MTQKPKPSLAIKAVVSVGYPEVYEQLEHLPASERANRLRTLATLGALWLSGKLHPSQLSGGGTMQPEGHGMGESLSAGATSAGSKKKELLKSRFKASLSQELDG